MEARRKIEATPPPGTAPAAAQNPLSTRRDRPRRPLEDAARLGRLQRHRGRPPQRRRAAEDLRQHPRRGGGESTSILLTGIALPPPDAPQAVKDVINNANAIVGRPYIWGGGHGSFYSYGYDCSGSVSFALFGGGMIPDPLTSGALEGWGAPGPGKWITVYANAGHTFAEIAGLRWDTVGDRTAAPAPAGTSLPPHRRLRRPPPAGVLRDRLRRPPPASALPPLLRLSGRHRPARTFPSGRGVGLLAPFPARQVEKEAALRSSGMQARSRGLASTWPRGRISGRRRCRASFPPRPRSCPARGCASPPRSPVPA